MEDREIVDLYWQRSDLAISETDRKYGRYCRTIARNICGDEADAEECVNDTWFSAWNRMPAERPHVLSAYLGCITRSLAINKLRAGQRQKRGGGEAPLALDELAECLAGGGDEPQRALEEKELEEAVGRFVAALPAAEKTVFVLRYWYLAPVAVIAKRMGFTQAKVKSSLFRTRKRLRDYLQKEGLC